MHTAIDIQNGAVHLPTSRTNRPHSTPEPSTSCRQMGATEETHVIHSRRPMDGCFSEQPSQSPRSSWRHVKAVDIRRNRQRLTDRKSTKERERREAYLESRRQPRIIGSQSDPRPEFIPVWPKEIRLVPGAYPSTPRAIYSRLPAAGRRANRKDPARFAPITRHVFIGIQLTWSPGRQPRRRADQRRAFSKCSSQLSVPNPSASSFGGDIADP